MVESSESPLFTHDESGPRFTIKDLSSAIALTGTPDSAAKGRIAAYAKCGQLEFRAQGGRTSPNLYAAADVAAAMMLSAVQDAGVADSLMLNAVGRALYSWTPNARATTHHPALAALIETLNGVATWLLRIDIYRDGQTGERTIVAVFYRDGEINPNPRVGVDDVPFASILIPAFNYLSLLRRMFAPLGGDA